MLRKRLSLLSLSIPQLMGLLSLQALSSGMGKSTQEDSPGKGG